MKQFIALLCCASCALIAAEVEITADKFFADEKKKISILKATLKS